MRWPGSGNDPIILDAVSLLASAARLALRSTTHAASFVEVRHEFGLWRLAQSGRPLPVSVRTTAPLELIFLCDAEFGEALSLTAQAVLALDRPLTAVGNPLPTIDAPVHLIFSEMNAVRRVALLARGAPAPQPASDWPLALENGLFRVHSPKLVLLTGTLQADDAMSEGRVSIQLDVRGFLPTLPDPYVANVQPQREFGRGSARGALTAMINWSANADTSLAFRGSPGSGGLARMKSSPRQSQPAGTSAPDESGQWSALERTRALTDARRAGSASRERTVEEARNTDARNLERLGRHAVEAGVTFGDGIRLLDVSTNHHQVGVQIRTFERRTSAAVASTLTVEGMHVTTPLAGVQVFMLPQVQWEPVATLDKDQDLVKFGYFPTPLASADDGGATLICSPSLKLAPVVPDLALDGLIETFAAGDRVGVMTTLPFGIRAVMALRPGPNGDQLALNNAAYTGQVRLQNALQLSARALGGTSVPGDESPSFAGAAAQLLNGVDLISGSPEGISVLGSPKDPNGCVETMFNNEFADAHPRVPITRLDLSGYGASTFSDWVNPIAMFAEASKVQFNVLVGRTAIEIVKFNSVLYPWGIRVTRMVTVERRGNGSVIRRDTGWQPESDGIFDFRYKDKTKTVQKSPYVMHPGIFRGLFGIRNIRPAPGAASIVFTSTTGETAEVLAYHFDCEAVLDDGAGEHRVAANGMMGFLHIRPVGQPLTAVDLAGLLRQQSAVGGPVDAEIAVGESGLRTRALRIEVDAAGTGVPEFVAAVRCAPRFGSNGAWSVIRQSGAGTGGVSADAEIVVDGAPLIREGAIQYLPGVSVPGGRMLRSVTPGPFRFADASDLFVPASPKRDYGFLQTTPTHAFLFRRPQIAAGDTRITSSLTPLFADIYARDTAQALFPPVENAIELRDRPYVLATNPATGRFRLDPPVSLPAPRGDLMLGDGIKQTMRLVYAHTRLSLTIDEDAWSIDMPALVAWNGFPDLPDLIGARSRLSGSSSGRSMVSEIDTLMTDWVETMLSFIPGMSPRDRPPPVELAATNTAGADKFTVQFIGVKRDVGPFEFKGYGTFFSGREDPENPLGPPVSYYGVLIGFEFEAQIPISPIVYLILGLEFEVGAKEVKSGFQKKAKVFIEIKAYVGFGVGAEVPEVYKLLGYLAGGPAIERDKDGWHFGGLGLIKAELEICKIVTMSISGEFVGIGRRQGDETEMEYTGVVEVNVSFWMLSIEVSWDLQFEQEM